MAQAAEQNILNLPLRVMFQDEARFGRLSDPRRCWAPAPLRPVVPVALVREYTRTPMRLFLLKAELLIGC